MAPPEDNIESEIDNLEAVRSLQKIAELKQLRTSTKGNITRIKTLLTKKGSNLSTEELECRLGILESYFKQGMNVQASIDKLCPEADTAANAAVVTEMEEAYVTTKTKIMSLLSKRKQSTHDASILNTTASVSVPRVRREVKLPIFEGKYSEYPKFMALFKKLIHQDESLDDCERFLILKEHLGARPLAAVADFDVTDENYEKAMKRLQECFDKKSLMFDEHISALFKIQKANKPSAVNLRQIVDSVNAHLSAMLTLGDYKDIANAMIIHIVMEKLDSESQVKWEESVDYSKFSTWEECSSILSRRVQNLEAREAKIMQDDAKPIYSQKRGRNVRNDHVTLTVSKATCQVCNKSYHHLPDCNKFCEMSIRDRYMAARKAKVCFNCLKKGHLQRDCSASKCTQCNFSHHQLLHRTPPSDENRNTSQTTGSTEETPSATTTRSSLMSMAVEPEIFLASAEILVKDRYGKYHRARAILDSASQINLMCDNLAQKLSLKKLSCQIDASGIGEVATKLKKRAMATVKSKFNECEYSLEFYLLPRITSAKPDRYFDISNWEIPKNINLADPAFNIPFRVDILIGAEIFLDLLAIGRILLKDNLPRLQKTTLGWIVSGKANSDRASDHPQSFIISSSCSEETTLDGLVQQFWEVEQIAPKKKFWTEEEKECEKIFLENVKKDNCGRFVVKIPFKPTVSNLGESYNAAERRLMALERRLHKDTPTFEAYNAFMNEYLNLGHMAEVRESDIRKIKYVAPYQIVVRPESSSTKLRVVFDCSCKTNTGLSLNDVMLKGPIVQDDLLSIILRFRCYKYAITADVAKMYRQMLVTDEDSNYQAVLWRPSSDKRVKVFRLRTVTYGTTSAPYLATRCLKKLGNDCVNEYPLASKVILSDFYMDDLISGSNNENEIFEIYDQINTVMNSAKLCLRKWYSNSERFLETVPQEEREKTLRLNDSEIIKTLGIVWAPVGDTFRYVWPSFDSNRAITKRIVLAELAMLFDPLGLINPVVVKGKIFMQDLWIMKVDWDESLPMNIHSQWTEYRDKLRSVEDIAVPRFVLSDSKFCRIELHGFADASKRAYGCCVYIRTVSEANVATVRLWSAKSRVAPLKTQSLPRLELMAAELLSQLVRKTRSNFPVNIDGIYLWTDSEIVLDWLSEHPSNWSTFIANRVSLIQEESKMAVWRHVPSKMNPADIISRGSYANDLSNSIWFAGPEFLNRPCCDWPPNKTRRKNPEANQERVLRVTTMITVQEKPNVLQWIENHSDFEKLQNKMALLMSAFHKNKSSKNINLNEILIRIVYCVQQHYLREEIELLSKNKDLPSKNKHRSLSLFIENQHDVPLLRVGGRLANACLPYDSKHQILLPNTSNFVRCYVRYLHIKHLHAGTQALMAILRQKFWIPHARKLIRSIVGGCLQCFKCRPKLCNQVMGDLPSARVSIAKPFSVAGVDFCGPIATTVKLRGCRTTKSYIAVFVCFCTKAVHLEVVSDLTAKAFIAALKRFIARRGACLQLFCDNATNFVGARRELDEMKEMFFNQQVQEKISKYCTLNSIKFRHIPPRSPHFGGLWEAAVKSAKYHLVRIFGESYLTFEELATVVAEVEAVLNSRPLSAMSNDPNDEGVLTPGDFLTGGPLVGIAEPFYDSKDWSHRDRWLMLSAIQQHFWKRWSKEYLSELQQKVKWTKKQRNLDEGDLVLVAEDNLPSKQWLVGRVTNVIRDPHGSVRVADIKTKNGEIRRAVHKLAPIPRSDS